MTRGYIGGLSLVGWLNLLQYLADSPRSIGDVCDRTYTSPAQVGHAVGCIERWGYVEVALKPRQAPRSTKADGWGSARKITSDTTVTPCHKGALTDAAFGAAALHGLTAVLAATATPRI